MEELEGILTPIDEASIVVIERLVRVTTLAESDGRDTLGMSLGIIGEGYFACWSDSGRKKLLMQIDASVSGGATFECEIRKITNLDLGFVHVGGKVGDQNFSGFGLDRGARGTSSRRGPPVCGGNSARVTSTRI